MTKKMNKNVKEFNELFESRVNYLSLSLSDRKSRKDSLRKLIDEFKSDLSEFVATLPLDTQKDVFWFLMDEYVDVTDGVDINEKKGLIIKDVVGVKCYNHIIGKVLKHEKKQEKKLRKKEKEESVYGVKRQ